MHRYTYTCSQPCPCFPIVSMTWLVSSNTSDVAGLTGSRRPRGSPPRVEHACVAAFARGPAAVGTARSRSCHVWFSHDFQHILATCIISVSNVSETSSESHTTKIVKFWKISTKMIKWFNPWKSCSQNGYDWMSKSWSPRLEFSNVASFFAKMIYTRSGMDNRVELAKRIQTMA